MQEAQKRGLDATDDFKAQMELARQTILIRELFADYQKNNPVTDADIQAEYDKFVAANGGKEYKARHILVEKEDQAKAIIADLKKGGKFEDIAKKQSKDPGSGANGGDLDWATAASYVPEFSEAMIKLKKGETTEAPVKTAVRLARHPRRRRPRGPAAQARRSQAADRAAAAAAEAGQVPGGPAHEREGRVSLVIVNHAKRPRGRAFFFSAGQERHRRQHADQHRLVQHVPATGSSAPARRSARGAARQRLPAAPTAGARSSHCPAAMPHHITPSQGKSGT